MEGRESGVKKTLRDLCLRNGCSYGVFWCFDPRNHLLLTMEDAYYEENAGSVVDSMRVQVHMLGEGKIGGAAFDGKHRWISVDSLAKGQNAVWDDSDFALQFSSGIETIVVIPLETRGVVQFGFRKQILETPEFLEQARKLLLEKDNSVRVCLTGTSSLNSDVIGQNGLLASVISSQNSFHGDVNMSTSWANLAENIGSACMLDSLPSPGGHFDGKSRDQSSDRELVTDPKFDSDVSGIFGGRPSNPLEVFEGQSNAHSLPSLFDAYPIDDFSQWLADPSKLCVTGLDPLVADDMLHTFKAECPSSMTSGTDTFSGIQGKPSAGLSHNPLHKVLTNDGLLVDQYGTDADLGKLIECLKGLIFPNGDEGKPMPIDTNTSISECISGVEGSSVAPRKGLFSELGLEHLLRDGSCISSVARSCVDDQWTISKRRRIETCQMSNNRTHLTGNSWEVKSMEPTSNGAQIPHFGLLKECLPKSQVDLWVDDCHSVDGKSCISGVSGPAKRPEEPPKPRKKKARPGESTRPRPKDRQMIADRIKELRDLIPNGAKLSIDALLGRTVKHMIFLQNLAKHVDNLKQLDEPKFFGRNQKENRASICSGSSNSRGATWAYEVGGQNLFCPIRVEDLSNPGEMLIEMICEERGYFLEIADVIRGLGLTIIKGVMESRHDEIWAHFIVEGSRFVTRRNVFVSLMQLLQGSSTSIEVNTASEPACTINNGGPSWSNYQHLVPFPI